ncbi:sensor histidine kinase [Microbacterium sp. YY-03]|uniref:sensor histidine kinase n=1 Tax=Microbacterium sp. YY-03 TaxID=3421636 RepID=UPI003D185666
MTQERPHWAIATYQRHRLIIDALGVVALSAVLALLGFGRSWQTYSVLSGELPAWAPLITVVPAAVFMLTKHRAPWLSLAGAALLFVVDLLTIGGIGPLLVLLDVLWFAAFHASPQGRRRLLWGILLTAVLIAAGAIALGKTDISMAVLLGIQFGVIFATDYWWAVAMAHANELAELHRQRADDATAEAERDRAEAVRQEREVMAKELHDVVAGHVLAMAIRAEAALSTQPETTTDRAALQAVRDAGIDAHAALRTMISVLRRGDGDVLPTPSLADLAGLVDDARRAGLEVEVSATEIAPLPAPLEQAVVRVVREALANCVRHASGAAVSVTLDDHNDNVRVRVLSQGGNAVTVHGYTGSGWGLSMLRERVDMMGGDFTAGPVAQGWAVEAVLPRAVAA